MRKKVGDYEIKHDVNKTLHYLDCEHFHVSHLDRFYSLLINVFVHFGQKDLSDFLVKRPYWSNWFLRKLIILLFLFLRNKCWQRCSPVCWIQYLSFKSSTYHLLKKEAYSFKVTQLRARLQRQNSLNDKHIFFHSPGSVWRFFFTTLCTFRHQSITCTSKNPHSAVRKTHCGSCKMYGCWLNVQRNDQALMIDAMLWCYSRQEVIQQTRSTGHVFSAVCCKQLKSTSTFWEMKKIQNLWIIITRKCKNHIYSFISFCGPEHPVALTQR